MSFTVQPVGFNPFRDQDKKPGDVAMLTIGMLAIVAVLVWAIFSG